MLLNIVVSYIVLDVAKYVGVLDELLEYTKTLADTWTPDNNSIEIIHIGKLVFKVRPIYSERTNQCEIRIEVVG